jgi:hypothetical protein
VSTGIEVAVNLKCDDKLATQTFSPLEPLGAFRLMVNEERIQYADKISCSNALPAK